MMGDLDARMKVVKSGSLYCVIFQQPHHLNRLDTSQWKWQGQNGMDMGRGAQDAIRLEPLSHGTLLFLLLVHSTLIEYLPCDSINNNVMVTTTISHHLDQTPTPRQQ